MKNFNFEPFDKVMVRNFKSENWRCSFFSHIEDNGECATSCGVRYIEVIPYNDDTKHLNGTSDSYVSPEEIPKFEFGDVVEWPSYCGIYISSISYTHACVVSSASYTYEINKSDLKLIRKGNFNG